MKRAFTLPEVILTLALYSLLLLVLSGSFIAMRKVSLSRSRLLAARLPVLQSLQLLQTDLQSSSADASDVFSEGLTICPLAPPLAGKAQWEPHLIVWTWKPRESRLVRHALPTEMCRRLGFEGGGTQPVLTPSSALSAFLSQNLDSNQSFALGNFSTRREPDRSFWLEAESQQGQGPSFKLRRRVGFRL